MLIKNLIDDFKVNKTGIYSVCSSDEIVIKASLKQAELDNSAILIEATCNQVNQYGGYTGMKPLDYKNFVFSIAQEMNFNTENIILGGDHLGTQPFKTMNSNEAMKRAKEMVLLFVEAGFTKIHLDASVRCLDDHNLTIEDFEYQACERVAEMAKVIEQSPFAENVSYIVGTEVPTPGGSLENEEELLPTTAKEAEATIKQSKDSFYSRNLIKGWSRVCGLVVQPGVEFSDNNVIEYNSKAVKELSNYLSDNKKIVYEAHSTDYQTNNGLKELVDDGFSILKVGPALTYAKREAVFALGRIEKELFTESDCSLIEQIIEEAMLVQPENWESHYHGSIAEIKLARKYSYSDRLRYYWPLEKIEIAMGILRSNLSKVEIPHTLLYEFMPMEYWSVREGDITNTTDDLLIHHVQLELKRYAKACKLSNK